MEYDEAVERLFERHRSVQSDGFSAEAYKPGLDAMRDYARRLGDPQERFRTVHVAGTNGKGSVCSMIAAALAANGLRTGLYTSPHLLDFRERMKLAGTPGNPSEMIPREDVVRFLEAFDMPGLTFFEVTTGMAFRWFADRAVDVAVVETGLGGLLDSTNIITPQISIITSIGLDHCGLLGASRAEIAFQKAGIFKPGVPALVWGRDPETQPVFERVASQKGCPLYFAEDFPLPEGAGPLDLQGPCQQENLRTACAALSILGLLSPPALEAIPHAGSITGLRGRWELLRRRPQLICDIAHNPPALEHNFARLKALGKPLLIVFGMMADKDIDSILPLLPPEAEYFPVQPRTPRAMKLSDLALKLKQLNISPQPSVALGVEAALHRAGQLEDPVIYIGGSTYVVSEAISYLESV